MGDLPDYTLTVETGTMEASALSGGADAAKSASPAVQDIYLATDTKKLYICVAAGAWTGFDFSILVQGILTLYANMLGGGFRITNIADPTAAQDAATRAYVLARVASYLPLVGGAMTGAIAMGANKITGLADPAAAQDAATKTYIDALLATVAQSQPARALDTIYTNGAKIRVVTVSAYGTAANTFTRIDAYCDAVDGATTIVVQSAGRVSAGANAPIQCVTFVVPPTYKYQVKDIDNATLVRWTEWELF